MDEQSLNHILAPLKPFQRRTVDFAFKRLFEFEDGSCRFLVADEAGLGKTMVARGVIAKTIHHLQDTVERIDIVYICSNTRIAHSNLSKLGVGPETSKALATRLTLLVSEMAGSGLSQNKVNLVSFTPGTSFNLRSQGGVYEERKILFHLLKDYFPTTTGLRNFLQCGVQQDNWANMLRGNYKLDEEIKQSFLTAYGQDVLKDQVEEFIGSYCKRIRNSWPDELNCERYSLIGRLRALLASVSVKALEPDLVILDEFQRFRNLLNPAELDSTAELAQKMFTAVTPEGNDVRLLLLSATPYRYYASNAELASEDHYEDFLETTKFLFRNDTARVEELKKHFNEYWKAINTVGDEFNEKKVISTKRRIESTLSKVMSRTERVRATEKRDAMVVENKNALTLEPTDVNQYRHADAIFNAVGDTDPMQYWKSASYITQFMHGYKFDDRLKELLDDKTDSEPEEFLKLLRANRANVLKRSDIEQWKKIDPGNAKIRDLMSEFFDSGWERLLWVPPTVPYWRLEGPFKGMENQTKALLFSAWNVVPDVVSGLLSYEAERRMVQATHFDHDLNYEGLSKQTATPLRLDGDPNRTSHRLFALLLPCLALANIHSLHALKLDKNPKTWVRSQIAELLKELPAPSTGKIDRRWEWAALVLLDPGLKTLLNSWRYLNLPLHDSIHIQGYLDDFLNIEAGDLGRRPKGLLNLLTDMALGSPAILAARSCTTYEDSNDGEIRRRAGAQIAGAFWHLFNRPAVTYLLRNLYKRSTGHEKIYWRLVLRYCRQGNLQAVLDEHWHWLWEQKSWDETKSINERVEDCVESIKDAVVPNPSRVHVRCFDRLIRNKKGKLEELRLRTVFALRYGKNDVEEGGRIITDDVVRNAFNSPFRPFVLASTSIGQEGLDFHPWCHRVVHWDLPSNPIDFEQREGRVHRYKGHAVRRNVASKWKKEALEIWDENTDLWIIMFELAHDEARELNLSDMVPCWVVDGDCKVERRVPLLPYTREDTWYGQLKHQLAAYRVVLGQSRQEEFLQWLAESNVSPDKLKQWSIDLEPPSA